MILNTDSFIWYVFIEGGGLDLSELPALHSLTVEMPGDLKQAMASLQAILATIQSPTLKTLNVNFSDGWSEYLVSHREHPQCLELDRTIAKFAPKLSVLLTVSCPLSGRRGLALQSFHHIIMDRFPLLALYGWLKTQGRKYCTHPI